MKQTKIRSYWKICIEMPMSINATSLICYQENRIQGEVNTGLEKGLPETAKVLAGGSLVSSSYSGAHVISLKLSTSSIELNSCEH